jgi:hypothetical protein
MGVERLELAVPVIGQEGLRLALLRLNIVRDRDIYRTHRSLGGQGPGDRDGPLLPLALVLEDTVVYTVV